MEISYIDIVKGSRLATPQGGGLDHPKNRVLIRPICCVTMGLMAMKPKEALLKAGDITEIKRGRLATDLIEKLKQYAMPVSQGGKGWDIEGYSVSTPTGASAPVVEKVAVSTQKSVTDIPDETNPEKAFQAFVYIDGKQTEIGMRTVCNRCKRSLTYGLCGIDGGNCRVWVDHDIEAMVNFKPRKSPVKKWW